MAFNITKTFRKYIPSIYITIIQEGNEWIIYSKVIKNGAIKNKTTKNFAISDDTVLPMEMNDYLETLQADYNFAYVSLFLDSMGQGAICGTSASDFEKNSIDIKNVVQFDIDKKWSVYASFIDINWIKKLFSKVGIDFIYSPFSIQSYLLKQEKIKKDSSLYILNHQDSIAISIFENGDLIFGAFFRTTNDEKLMGSDDVDDWDSEPEEKGIDDLMELDTFEEEDNGGFDGLEELEDLDGNLENEEFLDIKSQDKDLGHFDTQETEDTLELFGRDVLLYKYLTSSLHEYYKNPLYKSDFIEKIVLYDGYEVSSDFIEMLENDLFMDVEINKIDIHEVLFSMSLSEASQ